MAHAGQVLDNPVSGERIVFHKTAADTAGELLAIDLELSLNGHAPGVHVHPMQEERFQVISGRMRFRKGLKTAIAEPGDVVVVPPGTAHMFENAGEGEARARVEIRPALRMEELFETAVALAEEGRTTRGGLPKPLDLALFVREFKHEVRGAFPPAWIQRATLAPLAWLATKRGYAARYASAPVPASA
jgi:mannose-6-phosphate isomerase-like protein (cupin superfamily)